MFNKSFLFFQSDLLVNCHQPAWTQTSSSFSSVFLFQLSDLFSPWNLAMTSDSFDSACVSSPVTRNDNPRSLEMSVRWWLLLPLWNARLYLPCIVLTNRLSSRLSSNHLHSISFVHKCYSIRYSFQRKLL